MTGTGTMDPAETGGGPCSERGATRMPLIAVAAMLIALLAGPAQAAGFRDSYNRPNGSIGRDYTEYKGDWVVRRRRAAVTHAAPFSYATVRTGLSNNYRIDVDLTLSSTPRRANAGIVTLYENRDNHIFCKTEVTEEHTGGFLSIGHFLPGDTTSLLDYETKVGVHNGETYHMRFSRTGGDLKCAVSGGDLASPSRVTHELTAAERAAFGHATSSGLRSRQTRGEDDGGSRWDNFSVTPLR